MTKIIYENEAAKKELRYASIFIYKDEIDVVFYDRVFPSIGLLITIHINDKRDLSIWENNFFIRNYRIHIDSIYMIILKE